MKSSRIERATKKVLCWIMMIGGTSVMFAAGSDGHVAYSMLGAGHVIYGFILLTNSDVME